MRVSFTRRPDGGSVALVQRPDGVTLRLSSYDRVSPVPHDLAHLVAERAFRLRTGFWGSVAAGALFATLEVVSGRVRHDRAARSDAVRRAHARDLGLAESLAGLVMRPVSPSDAVVRRELDAVWQIHRGEPCPAPPSTLRAAAGELASLGERFRALTGDRTLDLEWPYPPERVAVPARSRR